MTNLSARSDVIQPTSASNFSTSHMES